VCQICMICLGSTNDSIMIANDDKARLSVENEGRRSAESPKTEAGGACFIYVLLGL
jgi:hypothetical protein